MKTKLVITALVIGLAGCIKDKPVVVNKPAPIAVETSIHATNQSFNKVTQSLHKSIQDLEGLNNQVQGLQFKDPIVLSLKETSSKVVQDIQLSYDTLNVETRQTITKLQADAFQLKSQVGTLVIELDKLALENQTLTTKTIQLQQSLAETKDTAHKWKLIGLGFIGAVAVWVGLKIYALVGTGGASSIIGKFLK